MNSNLNVLQKPELTNQRKNLTPEQTRDDAQSSGRWIAADYLFEVKQ